MLLGSALVGVRYGRVVGMLQTDWLMGLELVLYYLLSVANPWLVLRFGPVKLPLVQLTMLPHRPSFLGQNR